MTPLARIEALLEAHLGMAPGAVGGRLIESAVRRRLDATGTPDPAAYLARLQADGQELGELVDAVVVPETWFFRYPESFRHLAAWAIDRRQHAGLLRPLRVLSVPCCTGEEPYSVAMALLDAGLPPGTFRVEAADVSRRAIGFARAGVYGPLSFRETPAAVKGLHFDLAGANAAVKPEIRQAVSFREANLADPQTLAGEPPFDAIFCRNLFIYLTDAAKRTAVATLDRLLAADGVVYMGHAEPLGLLDGRFRSVGPPPAFAFARAATVVSARVAVPEFSLPTPIREAGGVAGFYPAPQPPSLAGKWEPERAMPAAPPLTRARAAADAGRAADAVALCEQFLAAHPPTADAFALLGVAHLMAGDTAAAERGFVRALYLDPGHYDALIHMMALLERRGDAAAAANYRRRAGGAARREVPA